MVFVWRCRRQRRDPVVNPAGLPPSKVITFTIHRLRNALPTCTFNTLASILSDEPLASGTGDPGGSTSSHDCRGYISRWTFPNTLKLNRPSCLCVCQLRCEVPAGLRGNESFSSAGARGSRDGHLVKQRDFSLKCQVWRIQRYASWVTNSHLAPMCEAPH